MERTVRLPFSRRAPVRGPKRLLAVRSDDRLVESLRAGDESAFEVLYERHVAGVLSFCRHMLGSQEEAEDAVQQAFLSAHGSIVGGSREIVFKPWLYTIARNRCLSVLRARREQPSELPEISTAGLNAEVERRADLRELVADLQRLPEQQRAALVLSELGDLSHAEVAEVIGQQPQAIKGLVFRAREALAERRDARDADCADIRLELASATGGGLRKRRLRYHLDSCPGCAFYLDEVRRQRRLLGIALPVAPTLALKDSVIGGVGSAGAAGLAATGGGTTATLAGGAGAAGVAAGGGASAIGGTLLGGTAVKLAVAGVVLAGGAGVAATEAVRDDGGQAPPATPPAAVTGQGAGLSPDNGEPGRPVGGQPAARALERRHGRRGAQRRALGQRRAEERSAGRSAAGEAHGKAGDRGAAGRAKGGAGSVRDRAPGRSANPVAPASGKPPTGSAGSGHAGGRLRGATEPPPAREAPRRRAPDAPSAPPSGAAVPDKAKGGAVQDQPTPD